jgi:hypothetical protein
MWVASRVLIDRAGHPRRQYAPLCHISYLQFREDLKGDNTWFKVAERPFPCGSWFNLENILTAVCTGTVYRLMGEQ